MTYLHFDERVAEFHIQVYNLMREEIAETGLPMKQGVVANKLRSARATVRNALIDLDKWGYVRFTRFQPQTTTITDPERRLTLNPYEADSKGRLPGVEPTVYTPAPKPKAPSRAPVQRMPWVKHGG